MTELEKQLSLIYEAVFDCSDTKRIDYRVAVNSANVNRSQIFIDKNNNPFQFDNSQDIISYCKGNTWVSNNDRDESVGNVSIDFIFAYKGDTKDIGRFIYELRSRDVLINKIETDPAFIFRNYWNILESDARYPRNYRAIVIYAVVNNVELNEFL